MNRLDRYRRLLSPGDLAQLEVAIQRPPPPAIRVNTLKIDVESARRAWPQARGWQVRPVPFCPAGWQITEGGGDLSRTLEHRMGQYYIQEAASMLPAEVFAFDVERPLVLDMAASPGGKTTHLTCKINDAGLIVANDSSADRIGALRANLRNWGAFGAAITNFPGERFGNWLPETFDLVLLDAPCSGDSLRTAERRKTRPVSDKERGQLHHRQVRLLTSAFQALKPGGQVVYATCTLAPEEDEAVVDALLREFPRQAEVEAVDHVLAVPAPGLIVDGERRFNAQVQQAVRLWPHLYDTSGFFAARIRKRDAVPITSQPPPARSLEDAGYSPLPRSEQSRISRRWLDSFDFDLEVVAERQALTLWRRGRSVLAVPELHLAHFADLSCVAAGMIVAEDIDGFAPSHELVSRFEKQFQGSRYRLAADLVERWLQGYDLRNPGEVPYPAGSVILFEDDQGRYLGRGKVLRDRIRNLLPKK